MGFLRRADGNAKRDQVGNTSIREQPVKEVMEGRALQRLGRVLRTAAARNPRKQKEG